MKTQNIPTLTPSASIPTVQPVKRATFEARDVRSFQDEINARHEINFNNYKKQQLNK